MSSPDFYLSAQKSTTSPRHFVKNPTKKHLVIAVVASVTALTPDIMLAASSVTLSPTKALRIGSSGGENWSLGQEALSVFNYGSAIQHSIMQFDLGSIPEYAIITSAQLGLTAYPELGSYVMQQSGQYSEVFAVTTQWDINANWNDAANAIQWSNPGGDVTGSTYATNTETIIPSSPVPVTWDVTDLVSQWTSGTLVNNGLMLKGSLGNGLHFYPITSTDPSYAPMLTVSYTIPEPATPMLCMPVIIGLACRCKRNSI